MNKIVGVVNRRGVGENGLDVGSCLINVALNIHSEAGSFRDGKTEIEGDNTRNATKTDEDAPHVINRLEVGDGSLSQDGGLVSGSDDEGDQGGSYGVEIYEQVGG